LRTYLSCSKSKPLDKPSNPTAVDGF
jgi:hypothetical protein